MANKSPRKARKLDDIRQHLAQDHKQYAKVEATMAQLEFHHSQEHYWHPLTVGHEHKDS